MSYSSAPQQPSGDGPVSLFFSGEPAEDKGRTTVASFLGICAAVVLLPCLAVGAFWAVITLIEGAGF